MLRQGLKSGDGEARRPGPGEIYEPNLQVEVMTIAQETHGLVATDLRVFSVNPMGQNRSHLIT
jgi:hypothetical protein